MMMNDAEIADLTFEPVLRFGIKTSVGDSSPQKNHELLSLHVYTFIVIGFCAFHNNIMETK